MATLKVPVTAEDHIQGNNQAPVTLVEYGDYECIYCGIAHEVIKRVQKHFGDQLRFVFRNFPMKEAYPLAEPAAEAAEYAAENGQFWEMHDLIYENQRHLSIPLLFKLVEKLGLPSPGLELAIEKKVYEPKIQKDFMGGVRSGVNGTPTFYVNDQRHIGPFDYEDIVAAVESVLVK